MVCEPHARDEKSRSMYSSIVSFDVREIFALQVSVIDGLHLEGNLNDLVL